MILDAEDIAILKSLPPHHRYGLAEDLREELPDVSAAIFRYLHRKSKRRERRWKKNPKNKYVVDGKYYGDKLTHDYGLRAAHEDVVGLLLEAIDKWGDEKVVAQ